MRKFEQAFRCAASVLTASDAALGIAASRSGENRIAAPSSASTPAINR